MNLIALAIMTTLLPGCVVVGGGVVTQKTSEVVVPSYLTSDAHLRKFCPSASKGVLSDCKENKLPKKDAFLTVWGSPKSARIMDGKEYLSYNRNMAWQGLVIFAGIPIPLLIPAGHNTTVVVFEREKLVQVNSEYVEERYHTCLIELLFKTQLGCKTERH